MMNALCPVHGYLVRRTVEHGMYFKLPGSSEDGDEEDDEGDGHDHDNDDHESQKEDAAEDDGSGPGAATAAAAAASNPDKAEGAEEGNLDPAYGDNQETGNNGEEGNLMKDQLDGDDDALRLHSSIV